MGLFDVEMADAALGWRNIKAAESPIEASMKAQLEKLWTHHEPAPLLNGRWSALSAQRSSIEQAAA